MANNSDSRGPSNTPAERTGFQLAPYRELRILIDWLGFTFTDENYSVINVLEVFEYYLGIPQNVWQPGRKFYEGYANSFVFENINIYYDGDKTQGIHCDITGQGCRFIELIYQKLRVQDGWFYFMKNLRVHENVKFTRIDIACDDFFGFFTLDMIYDKLMKGEAKSKFKSWYPDGRFNFKGENTSGLTLNFGSKESRFQCQMYEKSKQLGLDYFWNRIELRYKHQRAEDIVKAIMQHCNPENDKTEDIGLIFASSLKDYLTFLEPSETDSNKRRWKVSPFWKDFLDGVEPRSFASALPDRDIAKIHIWWERQISKSLAILTLAYHDNNPDFMEKMFKDGVSKLTKEDMRIIEDYRRMVKWKNEYLYKQLETNIFTQTNENKKNEPNQND